MLDAILAATPAVLIIAFACRPQTGRHSARSVVRRTEAGL